MDRRRLAIIVLCALLAVGTVACDDGAEAPIGGAQAEDGGGGEEEGEGTGLDY